MSRTLSTTAQRPGRGVLPVWPDYFDPRRGQPVPADLVGATVVRIGTPDGWRVEGGGLVLDYQPAGAAEVRRTVNATHKGPPDVVWTGRVRPPVSSRPSGLQTRTAITEPAASYDTRTSRPTPVTTVSVRRPNGAAPESTGIMNVRLNGWTVSPGGGCGSGGSLGYGKCSDTDTLRAAGAAGGV